MIILVLMELLLKKMDIGQLENGIAKGKGEMLIKNKMKYKGEFNDDLPCGIGVLENLCDGSVY